MVVDLNTQAFYKAQNGDIFTIEIVGNKKHASPISKEKLFEGELKRLNSLEAENESLKEQMKQLQEENQLLEKRVDEKIKKFLEIFKGGN